MQASISSKKCMALAIVSQRELTPPAFTTVLTILGEMSIKLVKERTAWTREVRERGAYT